MIRGAIRSEQRAISASPDWFRRTTTCYTRRCRHRVAGRARSARRYPLPTTATRQTRQPPLTRQSTKWTILAMTKSSFWATTTTSSYWATATKSWVQYPISDHRPCLTAPCPRCPLLARRHQITLRKKPSPVSSHRQRLTGPCPCCLRFPRRRRRARKTIPSPPGKRHAFCRATLLQSRRTDGPLSFVIVVYLSPPVWPCVITASGQNNIMIRDKDPPKNNTN